MQAKVQKMLDKNAIRASNSTFSPRFWYRKRRDPTENLSTCFVSILELRYYVRFLPHALVGGSHFRTVRIQILHGFWLLQRILANRHQGGTQKANRFPVPSGHYEFIMNCPSVFQTVQRTSNDLRTLLKNSVGRDCFVFIEIILFPGSAKEHARKLEIVLQIRKGEPAVTPREIMFAQPKVQYSRIL